MKSKVFLKAYVEKVAENKYRAIASTDAVDRYGDVVDQSGWMLENYLKNPVMLWAHDSSQLPVAKCTAIDRSQAGKLIVDFEFAPADASPLAPYVKASYDGGFLNALSVGFMANEKNGNVITQSELLEISFVPVPANQEALRLAVSKGLDISMIEKDLKSEEKGEVTEEVDAIEATKEKWENWDKIGEILSALWTVYFDEKTPVEDFSKLLTEAVELLQDVADEDGVEEDEALAKAITARKEKITKFLGGRTIKAGKTISKKNEKLIRDCMSHMQEFVKCMGEHSTTMTGHHAALEEMLSASSSSDTGSGKSVEVAPTGSIVMSKDDLLLIRSSLRANDRGNEVSLTIVNKFLSAKEGK